MCPSRVFEETSQPREVTLHGRAHLFNLLTPGPYHITSSVAMFGRCFCGDTDLLGAVKEMVFQLESDGAAEKLDVWHLGDLRWATSGTKSHGNPTPDV